MVILSRLLSRTIWQRLNLVKTLNKEAKFCSSSAEMVNTQTEYEFDDFETEEKKTMPKSVVLKQRYILPEFLPDPDPRYRNSLRESLERLDMLARRSVITIPEFYVGSILAVTYSEKHAVGKINRFVGICILREGCGLRASCILRNVIDGEGVEVRYDLYDPAIQKVECLRLEKRLDKELLYLRDAPPEYCTFPVNMDPELAPLDGSVPLNTIQVPLENKKWLEKWELKDLKGVKDMKVNERRRKRAEAAVKPWEKYDLMKIYRETIPREEQEEIFAGVELELNRIEIKQNIMKARESRTRPKKAV